MIFFLSFSLKWSCPGNREETKVHTVRWAKCSQSGTHHQTHRHGLQRHGTWLQVGIMFILKKECQHRGLFLALQTKRVFPCDIMHLNGSGTGKSHVLVHYLKWLICQTYCCLFSDIIYTGLILNWVRQLHYWQNYLFTF